MFERNVDHDPKRRCRRWFAAIVLALGPSLSLPNPAFAVKMGDPEARTWSIEFPELEVSVQTATSRKQAPARVSAMVAPAGKPVGGTFIDERGRTCATFSNAIMIEGHEELAAGIACRNVDGRWMLSEEAR